jgi:RNA ligase
MNYKFPVITHIDQVRAAIAGRDEFKIAEKDDYLVVNYFVNFADTFPAVEGENAELFALRRECRGLIFSAATGEVLARRYHKFFNLDERDETRHERIDFNRPHVILEKLDGSMITPFYSNDKLRWGTKMGYTDVAAPVEDWIKSNPHYERWAMWVMAEGKHAKTPIFEWCSRKQRIVIDHPVDRLVLTAIRDNATGEYLPYDKLQVSATHGIEVVRALPGNAQNILKLVDEARGLKDMEGYVIRFDNGMMLKIKADDYCRIHSTKEMVNWEKDVIAMILNEKADDQKAFMLEDDRKSVEQFEVALHAGIAATAERLKWLVIEGRDNFNGSKKRFAIEMVNNHPVAMEKALLFKIWDKGEDAAFEVVKELIASQTGSQSKVDAVRPLFGNVKWWDFRNSGPIDLDG